MVDTTQKYSHAIKKALNTFIALSTPYRIAVIDSCLLNSVTTINALSDEPRAIDVLNYNPLDLNAHDNAFMHSGVSTTSLSLLSRYRSGEYGSIYLDYCGTPRCNAVSGFDPESDISSAYTMLRQNGLLVVTFSKRGVRNVSGVAARMLAKAGFRVVRTHSYKSSSAMVSLLAVKGSSVFEMRMMTLWAAISCQHSIASDVNYIGEHISYMWNKDEWYTGTIVAKKGVYHTIVWDSDGSHNDVRLREGRFRKCKAVS